MLEYSVSEDTSLVQVRVYGRTSLDDYQKIGPSLMEALQARAPAKAKMLIEVISFDPNEPDPGHDLGFWTLRESSSYLSKLAVVCPKESLQMFKEFVLVVENRAVPVRVFDNKTEAFDWLE